MHAGMDQQVHLDPRELVTALKAAAEPTRLRILLLLQAGEQVPQDCDSFAASA